jgi:glucose dehydrogenase
VKLTRATVIAALAFAYSVWAIWGSGEEWLAKGFMLLLFGIPVYVWMKWRQRRDTPTEEWALRRSHDEARVPVGLGLE